MRCDTARRDATRRDEWTNERTNERTNSQSPRASRRASTHADRHRAHSAPTLHASHRPRVPVPARHTLPLSGRARRARSRTRSPLFHFCACCLPSFLPAGRGARACEPRPRSRGRHVQPSTRPAAHHLAAARAAKACSALPVLRDTRCAWRSWRLQHCCCCCGSMAPAMDDRSRDVCLSASC